MTIRHPRARTHDLRKGQWLHHNITNKYTINNFEYNREEIMRYILCMENEEFEKIMNGYEEGEWLYPFKEDE